MASVDSLCCDSWCRVLCFMCSFTCLGTLCVVLYCDVIVCLLFVSVAFREFPVSCLIVCAYVRCLCDDVSAVLCG